MRLPKLTNAQALAVAHLDRIAATLDQMRAALEQERADLGTADYCTSSLLDLVGAYLTQALQFWTQTGPEYETPPAYWSEELGQLVTVPED
jgi:hypothetical protein